MFAIRSKCCNFSLWALSCEKKQQNTKGTLRSVKASSTVSVRSVKASSFCLEILCLSSTAPCQSILFSYSQTSSKHIIFLLLPPKGVNKLPQRWPWEVTPLRPRTQPKSKEEGSNQTHQSHNLRYPRLIPIRSSYSHCGIRDLLGIPDDISKSPKPSLGYQMQVWGSVVLETSPNKYVQHHLLELSVQTSNTTAAGISLHGLLILHCHWLLDAALGPPWLSCQLRVSRGLRAPRNHMRTTWKMFKTLESFKPQASDTRAVVPSQRPYKPHHSPFLEEMKGVPLQVLCEPWIFKGALRLFFLLLPASYAKQLPHRTPC